jgi:hypothetical protein
VPCIFLGTLRGVGLTLFVGAGKLCSLGGGYVSLLVGSAMCADGEFGEHSKLCIAKV